VAKGLFPVPLLEKLLLQQPYPLLVLRPWQRQVPNVRCLERQLQAQHGVRPAARFKRLGGFHLRGPSLCTAGLGDRFRKDSSGCTDFLGHGVNDFVVDGHVSGSDELDHKL